MKHYLSLFLIFFIASCTGEHDDDESMRETMAYVPTYSSNINTSIEVEKARSTTNAGKIYAYKSYLFQVEQYEGIHIIDNATPAQARKIAFLRIPICTEIAIKDNHLYTNSFNDLVVFDLSDILNPKLVKRLEDAFPIINQSHPPFSNVYFECPDPSKGTIVRWDRKLVKNPTCRR